MMREKYRNSFRSKVQRFVVAAKGSVVLRSELDGLGSSWRISRTLKALIADGDLVRLGHGIYVKA